MVPHTFWNRFDLEFEQTQTTIRHTIIVFENLIIVGISGRIQQIHLAFTNKIIIVEIFEIKTLKQHFVVCIVNEIVHNFWHLDIIENAWNQVFKMISEEFQKRRDHRNLEEALKVILKEPRLKFALHFKSLWFV